jgi:serine protease AprX
VASLDFTGAAGRRRVRARHARRRDRRGRGGRAVRGLAPGSHIVSLKVLGADGSGREERRDRAIDWVENHGAVQHPGHQPVAGPAGVRVVAGRSADARRSSGRSRAGWSWLHRRAISGRRRTARRSSAASCRRATRPSALTVGALNTKGTAFTVRRRDGDVQLAGPTRFDGLLKPELAAPGNRMVAAAGRGRTWRRRTRSGWWRATATTPTWR